MSRHRQSEQQSRRDGDNKGYDQKHRSEQRRNQNIVQRRVRKDSLHSQTRQWQVGADKEEDKIGLREIGSESADRRSGSRHTT